MAIPDTEGPTTAVGLLTAIGVVLGWLRLRRKDDSDERVSQAESVNDATKLLFETQSTIISHQNEKILRLEGRLDQISSQIRHLLMENSELRGQVLSLQIDNKRLTAEVRTLEADNMLLRGQISFHHPSEGAV